MNNYNIVIHCGERANEIDENDDGNNSGNNNDNKNKNVKENVNVVTYK